MIKPTTKYHRTSLGRRVAEKIHLAYCDLCGMPEYRERARHCDDGVCWHPDENTVAETHLCCLSGLWERADHVTGRVKRIEVHLCPTCFTEKLLPWLKSQGGKPSVWRHDAGDSPLSRAGFV